ncbi:MAG: hypothetical protein ABFD54_06425 [Armatimonadota bacterium]|nr:hypothetical protein [bacterium]
MCGGERVFRRIQSYTAHPSENELAAVLSEEIDNALSNIYHIPYSSFDSLYSVVSGVADHIAAVQPDLVFFFASGGLAIALPTIQYLPGRLHTRAFENVFHMLPGLNWPQKLHGATCFDYAVSEMEALLAANAKAEDKLKVLCIDTTGVGNAVRRIVQALTAATDGISGETIDVYIVAVVNGRKSPQAAPDLLRISRPDDEDFYIQRPTGYGACGYVTEGEFAQFTSDTEEIPNLQIAYVHCVDIFTEDNAELLGIAALAGTANIEASTAGGELVVDLPNGRWQPWLGCQSVGHRIWVALCTKRDQNPLWQRLDELAAKPSMTPSEELFIVGSGWGQRLQQLDSGNAATILEASETLQAVDLYWLRTRGHFEPHYCELAAHTLSVSDDITVIDYTLQFLRIAYPSIAARKNQSLHIRRSRQWWLGQLR